MSDNISFSVIITSIIVSEQKCSSVLCSLSVSLQITITKAYRVKEYICIWNE